jgi:hypothetical protein
MKATLEFNLNDHEDKLEHKRAINATSAYLVLWDLDNHVLREMIKYNGDKYSEETLNIIMYIRGELHRLMDEKGVSFQELE